MASLLVMRRILALTLAVTLVTMGISVPAAAWTAEQEQPSNGEIRGVALGVPVPVTVQLKRPGTTGRLRVTTDADGAFTFTGLPPGRFEIEVVVDGKVIGTSGPLELSAGAMVVSGVTVGRDDATVVGSFQELATRVRPGTTVSVIDTTGNEITGEIAEISSSSLALLIDGNRRDMPESSVLRIARRGDPLWNGVGIGAGIGAGTTLAVMVASCASYGCSGDAIAAAFAGSLAFGAGVGAGIGALVDAVIGGEVLIFQASGASNTSTGAAVSLSPLLAQDRKGLLLSVRF